MKIKKENFLIQVKYSDLLSDPGNIDRYFLGFGGELYFSTEEIANCDSRIIDEIKTFIKKNSLPLNLHAPIPDIDYSKPKDTASLMRSLYEKVITLCKDLNVNSIVAHAELNYNIDFPIDEQLKNAVDLWGILCGECAANKIAINVENHCEIKPDHLIELRRKIGSRNFGLCIDVGHCNAYGRLNIEGWLREYPVGSIREIHLADNVGDDDTHLPLGRGNIDLEAFFKHFAKRDEKAIFVLEPRNVEEAEESLAFLKKKGFLVE